MKKINNETITKISISVALATVLVSGCGSSSNVAKDSTVIQTEKPVAQKSTENRGTNAITGTIELDTTPVETRATNSIQTLSSSMYAITAYNLDNKSVYKTTTDASGVYSLAGMSDGRYQVYAENDAVSKSSIKRVTLSRGTRAVVDFTLQAAGSVKGKIAGVSMVYIPGKDFVSFADNEGNFELTNIPVGTYMLGYKDNYGRSGEVEITVQTGMSDLGEINPAKGIKLETKLEYGVLGLKYEGIGFYSYSKIDEVEFKNSVKLINDSGENIDIETSLYRSYEPMSENIKSIDSRDYSDDYSDVYTGHIVTKEIVPSGNYTLIIPASVSEGLTEDIEKKFFVDAVSVTRTNYDFTTGSRYLSLTLPKDLTTIEQSTLSSLQVREKGNTSNLDVKPIWTKENSIILLGNYKTGVEYEFVFTDAQKALVGTIAAEETHKLSFEKTELSEIYPSAESKDVPLNQRLYVNVKNINELDTSSVKVTLNDGAKDITIDNKDIEIGRYSSYYNYYGYEYKDSISFLNVKLEYGKNYTMKVEAKDIYGTTMVKESSFTTLVPSVSSLSPHSINDLFKDSLSASFNVEIKKDTGAISIEDLTDSGTSASIQMHEFDSLDSVLFEIEGLTPNHRYKITASGFKTLAGTDIPAKSTEFSAPPRMLFVDNMYRQNLNVTAEKFQHKVEFSVFGKLIDSEKEFMRDHLQVTSYGELKASDATHPTRKLFFKDEGDSTYVTVAFTIDAGTNYELFFDDVSGLKDIVMPRGFEANMPLVSFSTKKSTQVDTVSEYRKVIRDMQLSNDGTKGDVQLSLKVPIGVISNTENCWSKYDSQRYELIGDIVNHLKLSDMSGNAIPYNYDYNYEDEYKYDYSYRWSINTDYSSNETRTCTLENSNVHVSFESDYNTTYIADVDFTDLEDMADGYGGLSLSKQFTTAEIGQLHYWLDNNGGENELVFHIDANALFVNPDIFKVVMDGTEYTSDTTDVNTSSLIFKLPRPLYSVAEFTLSKDDGSIVSFYNKSETVEKADILATPKTFMESVSPDFIPVEVKKVATASVENKIVVVDFNRAVNMSDVVTYDDTKSISDIAFEVKDTNGTSVTISEVFEDNNQVMFMLEDALDTTEEYTITLKEGKTIRSAFGVQKLTTFSATITPTIVQIADEYVVYNYGIIDNKNNPYELGSTSKFDDTGSSYKVVVAVDRVTNATIALVNSKVSTTSTTSGDLMLSGNKLIQQLSGYYYSDSVNAHVAYTFDGEIFFIDEYFSNLRNVNTASLYSISGSGTDSMNFNFSGTTNDAISKENFKVYTEEGLFVKDAIANVQLQNSYNSDVTVTFQNLTADTIYRVDVEGISSNGDKIDATVPVAQVYIKTLPTN